MNWRAEDRAETAVYRRIRFLGVCLNRSRLGHVVEFNILREGDRSGPTHQYRVAMGRTVFFVASIVRILRKIRRVSHSHAYCRMAVLLVAMGVGVRNFNGH